MKRKIYIVGLLLLGLILIYRFLFSYTILSIPIVGDAFEGADKEQFDFCILNPLKIKGLENKYKQYMTREDKIRLSEYKHFRNILDFKIKNIKEEENRLYVYLEVKIKTSWFKSIFITENNQIIASYPSSEELQLYSELYLISK